MDWALQIKLTDLLYRAVMRDDTQAEAVLVDAVLDRSTWSRSRLEDHFRWCRYEWARYWFRARDATPAGADSWVSKLCEAKLRETLAWAVTVPGLIEVDVHAAWTPTGYSDWRRKVALFKVAAELSTWDRRSDDKYDRMLNEVEDKLEMPKTPMPSLHPGYPSTLYVSGRAKWHRSRITLEVVRDAPFDPIPGWEREHLKRSRKFYHQAWAPPTSALPYKHWAFL